MFAFSSIRMNGMAMEHLRAANFRRVIEGQTTEGIKDILPPSFNIDTFFLRLREFLHAMHARGVVHNDLYLRNIMVDHVTGLPYIIDFGKAILDSELDKTKISFEDMIKRDLITLEAAEAEARKWLLSTT